MPEPRTRTAYRIAAFYALSFAGASLLLGFAIWVFASQTLRQTLDDRLQSELSTLQRAAAREGRTALIADIIARDQVPAGGGYMLAGRDGRRIAGKVATTMPAAGLSDVVLGGSEPGRAAAAAMPDGEVLAVIGEAGPTARVEATLMGIAVIGFGLMVAIGVAGGFLIGHSIHRRVNAVDDAARAIIDGNLARRVPVGVRGDEFDRLADTLNRMLDHIGQLMESLRHVSDDVAHDLRTPLARLRFTLEAAADAPDGARKDARIAEALERVDGLMDLFGAILRISEIERGAVRDRFVAVDLGALVRDLLESYAPAAQDSGRSITVFAAPDVVVRGDESLIGQAIVNLIENAIKHTPAGTHIRVDVARSDGRPALTVADDGPGIAEDDHALVLRRFGRRETSRSTSGTGLGLNMVVAIAATHGAELVLADAAPGLAVTMLFRAWLDDRPAGLEIHRNRVFPLASKICGWQCRWRSTDRSVP